MPEDDTEIAACAPVCGLTMLRSSGFAWGFSRPALDLSAAGGYTTELLARSIGPTGKVYGQSRPRDPNPAPTNPAAPEGNSDPNLAPGATPAAASPAAPRPSPVALADREA